MMAQQRSCPPGVAEAAVLALVVTLGREVSKAFREPPTHHSPRPGRTEWGHESPGRTALCSFFLPRSLFGNTFCKREGLHS